jgi:hypothetical protein
MKYILNLAEPLVDGGVLSVTVYADNEAEAHEQYWNGEMYLIGRLISVVAVPTKPSLFRRLITAINK